MYCIYKDKPTNQNYCIPVEKTGDFYGWLATVRSGGLPDYARPLGSDALGFDNPVVNGQPLFA